MEPKDKLPINVDISAKASLKLDLTEAGNELFKPGATVVGRLFAARIYSKKADFIQEQSIQYLNDQFEIEKHKLIKEAELLSLEKFLSIKEENITIPDPSNILPPIDALNIFYDKEHYRDMYARLIAISMDKSKYHHNIPAYTEMIKQISDVDYVLLKHLYNSPEYWNIGHLLMTFTYDIYMTHKFQSLKMLDFKYNYKKGLTADIVSRSIDNLQRLGLIYVEQMDITDSSIIDKIGNPEITLMHKEFLSDNKRKPIEEKYIGQHLLTFTNLGGSFISIMLEKPHRRNVIFR